MGKGVRIECRKCSTKQDFLLGVGWEYSSLETVIGELDPKPRDEVQKILQDHVVLQREYEWRLYLCGKCKKLYDRLWVRIKYDGDQEYETVYRCGKCDENLDKLHDLEGISEIPCWRCGERTLTVGAKFLWD
jgi:DNA-directed RNA polymerase subunit RPC12/RpoP